MSFLDEKRTGRTNEILTDLVSQRPEEFNEMTSALAQWVLAQHHGLKTRFLMSPGTLWLLFPRLCMARSELAVPRADLMS